METLLESCSRRNDRATHVLTPRMEAEAQARKVSLTQFRQMVGNDVDLDVSRRAYYDVYWWAEPVVYSVSAQNLRNHATARAECERLYKAHVQRGGLSDSAAVRVIHERSGEDVDVTHDGDPLRPMMDNA